MIDIHFSGKKINVNYFLVHDWYTALRVKSLNCHYDQILDTHFFLHFHRRYVFPRYLGKFQSISTNIRILELHFQEFMVTINFPCSKSW